MQVSNLHETCIKCAPNLHQNCIIFSSTFHQKCSEKSRLHVLQTSLSSCCNWKPQVQVHDNIIHFFGGLSKVQAQPHAQTHARESHTHDLKKNLQTPKLHMYTAFKLTCTTISKVQISSTSSERIQTGANSGSTSTIKNQVMIVIKYILICKYLIYIYTCKASQEKNFEYINMNRCWNYIHMRQEHSRNTQTPFVHLLHWIILLTSLLPSPLPFVLLPTPFILFIFFSSPPFSSNPLFVQPFFLSSLFSSSFSSSLSSSS